MTLIISGSVNLASTAENYAAISKGTSNTLKITSIDGDGATTGSLTATGGKNAAAIGGDYNKPGNNITIAGGTITAEGSGSGAGIGGGIYQGGSNITITGGDVAALSSDMGAGIGGGQASDGTSAGSDITISGGIVSASSSSGAGIGGGYSSKGASTGSNIVISGGTVTAKSSNGAGIGSGGNSNTEESCSSSASGITISGGTVTATSESGAGIGGGYTVSGTTAASNIVIYKSSVKASSTSGSSIGAQPVNSSGENVYLYEFTNTTKGEAIIVDGETVIDSVVYHSSSDTSQYIYLPKDSATAVYGGSYYTLSYSEEDGTATFTKTEIDSMEIPNAAALSAFAKMVNNGSTSLKGTVTADIDFSGYSDMIGSESTPYAGVFDGGGHTITVDYDISSGTRNSGLFSYADGGTVQDLTVDGSMDFSGDSGYTNVGGVVGYMNNGTISNVVSKVNITNTADCPFASAGGIVGRLYDSSTVEGCVYEGSLTAYNSWDCVGGIVGYTRQYCTIKNCANFGTLYATTGTNSSNETVAPYLGGIIGYINSSYFSGMEGCYNYGSVSADDTTYCGAIVGWLRNSSDNLTNNCWLNTSAEKAYGANDNSRTEPDSNTADEFAGGKVTYLLNGSTDGGTSWYQNLDNGETADSYPVLSSDHGTVNEVCYIYCPDCIVVFYSNTESGTTVKGSETNHTYENSVCIYCGNMEGELNTDSEGRYIIHDAATLSSFAAAVNSGSTSINGIVTADIDFTARNYMIGSSTYPYAGTFDGGGHTIKVDYDISSGTENIGLFSYIDGGTVQNLTVEGSMDFSGGSDYTNVGGVVGYMNNGTISNVASSVNITNTADYPLHSAGGIVGRLYDSSTVDKCVYEGSLTAYKSWDCVGGIVGYTYTNCTITNCANLGTLYATTGTNSDGDSVAPYLGGIIGYINSAYFSGMENCYNYGSVSADDTTYCGAIVGWLRNSKSVLSNNYWLETSAEKAYGSNTSQYTVTVPDSSTADEFESGEIAYLLNGSTSGGTTWYQTLSSDSYPVLDSAHGMVYMEATVYCPDCYDITGYNNTAEVLTAAEGGSVDEHTYENHTCIYCGAIETAEPAKASDGYYEIYTVPELYWLANAVNSYSETPASDSITNDTYYVRLMADIDLDGLEWTPIGFTSTNNGAALYSQYSYIGTFDGNGHVIKNMYVNGYGKNYVGFFGSIRDGDIKNLGIVDSCVTNAGGKVGGIAGSLYGAMTNCYYTGKAEGGEFVAGLIGYPSTDAVIKYCYARASVSSDSSYCGALFTTIISGMSISNCYYDNSLVSKSGGYGTGCSSEDFESGRVAYLLNGKTSGGTTWYQNLDNGEPVDSQPVLSSSHGTVYYFSNYYYCPDYKVSLYTNDGSSSGNSESHTYDDDGICVYCGGAEDGVFETDEGRVVIPDAETLYKFAKTVNYGSTALNAIVTADIDFSSYSAMIGSEDHPYAGTFDGGGYEITVGYDVSSGTENIGLFSYVDGGTVQNLNVSGSMTFSGGGADGDGYSNVGGVVGYLTSGTISDVTSSVNITASAEYPLHSAGGIVGRLYQTSNVKNCIYCGKLTAYGSWDALGGIAGYTYQYCSIKNCANLGTLYATKGTNAPYLGGILGYVNNTDFYGIQNCYNYGSVSADSTTYCGAIVGWLRGASTNISNNYWLDSSATKAFGTNGTSNTAPSANTADEFESGEVTYLLNENSSGSTSWYQNIDNGETADSYPVLDTAHGLVYYIAGYYYCPDCQDEYYSNDENAAGNTESHTYKNSVCIYCGAVDSSEFTTDESDRIIIPDAETLYKFASTVNAGETALNAIVTADINFSDYTVMIGSSSYPYTGTFDGGGYTITVGYNLTSAANNIGLFSYINGGTAQNLNVEGTMDFSGGSYENVGGVIGYMNNGTISNVVSGVDITGPTGYSLGSAAGIVGRLYDKSTVDKCIYTGKFTATDSNDCLGGIVGYTRQSCSITNCANLGTLYATTKGSTAPYLGGIIGYINHSTFVGLENCYNYGTVEADDTTYCGAIVGWLRNSNDVLSNNYWLETSATKAYGANDKNRTAPDSSTADDFAGGKIAYLLNGSTSGGTTWYQNIDNSETADGYPLLDSSHGTVYYVAEVVYCPDCTEAGYSNTETDYIVRGSETDHSYSGGVCEYCGAADSSLLATDSEGRYIIPDAPTLAAFATTVNSGSTGISGIVTADIDFTGYSVMIGSESKPYAGTFDGGGYTITLGYNITSGTSNIGLFSYINGGTVKNFNLEGYIDFTNAPKGDQSDGGYTKVGSVTGYLRNGSISNIVSSVDITSSKTYPLHLTGGIAGDLYEEARIDKCIYKGNLTAYNSYDALGGIAGYVRRAGITNSANLGTLYATAGTYAPYMGGIFGYVNSTAFYGMENCYNYGDVLAYNSDGTAKAETYCGAIAGYIKSCSLYITDNYWLDTSASKAFGTNGSNNIAPESSTAAQFESGEIAYLLNESVSGGTTWYQTIGTDSYPLLDSSHSLVYITATVYCPDSKDISGYNNSADEITVVGSETEHSYNDNGVCIYCHSVKAEEPSTASDGYYEIENAAQLYWLAEQVNQYANEDKSSSDTQNYYFVRLVNDIDLDGIDWTPIGYTEYKNGYNYYYAYSFIGIFDGNGHVIKNMTVNTGTYGYAGLFGSVVYSGSTIKNLGVVDSTVYGGGNNIGGIVGRLGDSTSMTNCYFTGTAEGYKYVGGLTGWSSAAITNCWASADVTGSVSPVYALIGTDSSSVSVTNCYYDSSKTSAADSKSHSLHSG
ncbi:MAG: hypothetical protein LUD81_07715 [Clostridiales bacterium]|nr:hypothetical protein [Clostridiales bacterium]